MLVLLVGWLIVSQFGGSSVPASQKYFNALRPIVASSNAAGDDFHKLMISPQMPVTQFKTELDKQLATSQTAVTNATDLSPPKQLQPVQPFLLQALQYRVNGLRCLIKNANAAYAAKTRSGGDADGRLYPETAGLRRDLRRFVLGRLDRDPQVRQHRRPAAHIADSWRPATPVWCFPRDSAPAIQRLSKPPTGLHGTEVGQIVAKPSGKVLKGAGRPRCRSLPISPSR